MYGEVRLVSVSQGLSIILYHTLENVVFSRGCHAKSWSDDDLNELSHLTRNQKVSWTFLNGDVYVQCIPPTSN